VGASKIFDEPLPINPFGWRLALLLDPSGFFASDRYEELKLA
jgi:hypothetical protein